MHTAFKIKQEMFRIELTGEPASRDDILDWDARDRLGVVINSPFGATGASLLIQLVATAFFDFSGSERRRRPVYPDMHLFHFGGPWGNHWAFDFWPDYKEVFVPADRGAMLAAINSRGITHLLVPDCTPDIDPFRYTMKEEAIMRLKRSFAYGADGKVKDADVTVTTSDAMALADYRRTVFPKAFLTKALATIKSDPARPAGTAAEEDARIGLARTQERLVEVREDDTFRLAAVQRLERAEQLGGLTETFRRIDQGSAIDMLGPYSLLASGSLPA